MHKEGYIAFLRYLQTKFIKTRYLVFFCCTFADIVIVVIELYQFVDTLIIKSFFI